MCNSYVASSLAGCPYLVSGTSPTHQLRILPGRIPSQPSGHLGQGDIPLTNGISSWSSGELDRWGRTYMDQFTCFKQHPCLRTLYPDCLVEHQAIRGMAGLAATCLQRITHSASAFIHHSSICEQMCRVFCMNHTSSLTQ
jgi:hypothetical protein